MWLETTLGWGSSHSIALCQVHLTETLLGALHKMAAHVALGCQI